MFIQPKKINEDSPWWLHPRPNWQPGDQSSQPWKTEEGGMGEREKNYIFRFSFYVDMTLKSSQIYLWLQSQFSQMVFNLLLSSETKQVHKCVRYCENLHLQCMMEEWCSPYSSWLSLMKGCSADRPPSAPPPQLLLFEEEDSRGSLEVSARGSTSPASPFFSGVWRQHMEGSYQHKHNSVHLNGIAAHG